MCVCVCDSHRSGSQATSTALLTLALLSSALSLSSGQDPGLGRKTAVRETFVLMINRSCASSGAATSQSKQNGCGHQWTCVWTESPKFADHRQTDNQKCLVISKVLCNWFLKSTKGIALGKPSCTFTNALFFWSLILSLFQGPSMSPSSNKE